jgi:predicted phage terminase large subunit-like protein
VRRGGLTLVIQTRWHRDDLAGRILHEAKTNNQRWREVRLAALAEDGDPLGRAPGEPLWPDRFPVEHLARVRDGKSPYYWRALYQQEPIAEGSTEWPDRYFGDEIWFDEWPKQTWLRVMALDPSKGGAARYGDYSAFVMMTVTGDGTMYVDADLEVRNIAVMVEAGIELARVFRPDWFAVETNQFQELLAYEMARVAKERNVNFPIHQLNNQVPKIVRIRRLTTYLAQGKFRFKRDSRGARLLVRQLRDFPHGDHDDGPDALEMAVRMGLAVVASRQQTSWGTTGRAIAVW